MSSEIKKAFVSFRVCSPQWGSDKCFGELLALFEKYKGITDEITFLTADTHPPLALEVVKDRAATLASRMKDVRKLGYSSGINILATIGHHEESLSASLNGEYTRMTDMEGVICRGSFCPNDSSFLKNYVVPLYREITSAKPDYIWIDDDVRLFGHMPIWPTCFCDNCLDIFETEFGVKHSRESLKDIFAEPFSEVKIEVQKNWLQHNRDTIARLLRVIEETVHDIAPLMPLGFMTGERPYEGYDFGNWAEILAGDDKVEVLWRPGGGFYTDGRMSELTEKSHEIGRQVSLLPDGIVSIQSEIENFPYQLLKKANQTTALEVASHIAAGCSGTALNVLSIYTESLAEYEGLLKKLNDMRPFYDLMAGALGRTKPLGVYTGWNKDSYVTNRTQSGAPSWFNYANEIFETGIPACYSLENASVTTLSGDCIAALGDEEIQKIFAGGVYLDAEALVRLNKRGYDDLTGFSVERFIEDDCIEQLVNHPVNGQYVNRVRNGRQSFYKYKAAAFKLNNEKAQIIAKMVDYNDIKVADCCMGLFENHLGGRVCVAGYYPWSFLQNLSKSFQIKSIFRWLSGEKLPVYIDSFHKVNVWIREVQGNKFAASLINASLDSAEKIAIKVLTCGNKITVYDMDCQGTDIEAFATDGNYKCFELPTVKPWHMVFVVNR